MLNEFMKKVHNEGVELKFVPHNEVLSQGGGQADLWQRVIEISEDLPDFAQVVIGEHELQHIKDGVQKYMTEPTILFEGRAIIQSLRVYPKEFLQTIWYFITSGYIQTVLKDRKIL